MIVPRLIERKRDGGRLEVDEIRELVQAYAHDKVPEYQLAALLMAIYFKGLDRDEMDALMEAMLDSGKKLDFSRLPLPRIDKHSTGGVGDKAVYFALGRAFAFLVSLNADRPSSHSTDQLHQVSNAGFAAGADIQCFADGRW